MTVERASTVIMASVLLGLGGCASSDGGATGTPDAAGNGGSGTADGGTAGNRTGGSGGGGAGTAGGGTAGHGGSGAGGASGGCAALDEHACAARSDCYYITRLLLCPGTQCPYVFDRCADNGCDPACTAGNVCVSNQTVGGALIEPNDAGICPTGMHPVPSGGTAPGHCENNPTYTCASRPAACSGALSCACAGALCASGHACQGATETQVSCVEAVP
jgi:hypothetical protein